MCVDVDVYLFLVSMKQSAFVHRRHLRDKIKHKPPRKVFWINNQKYTFEYLYGISTSSIIFGLARRSFSWVKQNEQTLQNKAKLHFSLFIGQITFLPFECPELPPQTNPHPILTTSATKPWSDKSFLLLGQTWHISILHICSGSSNPDISPQHWQPEKKCASGGTGGSRQAALEQVLVARFFEASRAVGGDCGGIFKVTIELQILFVHLFGT